MSNISNTEPKLPQDTLLYRAAITWAALIDYRYSFIYGFRKKLHNVSLTFSPKEFYHLAGFHYLNDLAMPRYNAGKLISNILDGTVTQEQIEKGVQYHSMTEPRLLAMSELKRILEEPFQLYSFRPEMYPFYTNLSADFLIASHIDNLYFVFLVEENRTDMISNCICSSAFVKDTQDYGANQRSYVLLKKTRTTLSTGAEEVLFIKDRLLTPNEHSDNTSPNMSEYSSL